VNSSTAGIENSFGIVRALFELPGLRRLIRNFWIENY
jgi:hypothetical protein